MKINIHHIAKLANLPIDEVLAKKLEKQLEAVLEHIENLNTLDTAKVEPTSQVTGLENITREDIATPSLSQEEALKNTKSVYNGFFKVDAILDDN